MIAIGAMLLIFGSQTITGDLVIEEGRINSSTELRIIAELDPDINTQGVYAIQTIEGKEYDISAIVLDPSNVKIRNVSVDRNSFEDNFEIDSSGTYTLIINTPDPEDIGVVGGIGHVPDSTGVTISIIGFFMIVLGMAGVMVIGFMIIRQRKKKSS
jgi:carbonic anhydrase